MTIIVKNKSRTPKKRRIRKNKGNFHKEAVELFDGEVKIFRTNASGDVWQCRIRVSEEGKYFRKSLRTKNLEDAKKEAKKQYHEIHGKLMLGQPIFDRKYKELVDEYLEHELKSVEYGEKSHGRYVTIRSQMKHFLNFVGPAMTVAAVSNESFKGYLQYRRSVSDTVRQSTVLNEIATIKHFYRWAEKRKYISLEKFPDFGKMKPAKSVEKINRDAIPSKDYKRITKYLEHWHRKISDEEEKFNRMFVREFVIVLANTGIRFGEARLLKWKDVNVRELEDSSIVVELDIREGKTGSRFLVGRRGDVFERIKRLSNFISPNDYVFVNNKTGEQIVRKVYYNLWKTMMREIGFDKEEKPYVYYSLRHSFATWRLAAGVDVYTLSKIMGTSVKNIEDHYGHIDIRSRSAEITKDMKPRRTEIIPLDD